MPPPSFAGINGAEEKTGSSCVCFPAAAFGPSRAPKLRVCFSRGVFGCVACHTGTLFGCVESCVAGVLIPPAGTWKKLLDGSEGEPCPWSHWLICRGAHSEGLSESWETHSGKTHSQRLTRERLIHRDSLGNDLFTATHSGKTHCERFTLRD